MFVADEKKNPWFISFRGSSVRAPTFYYNILRFFFACLRADFQCRGFNFRFIFSRRRNFRPARHIRVSILLAHTMGGGGSGMGYTRGWYLIYSASAPRKETHNKEEVGVSVLIIKTHFHKVKYETIE